MFEHRHQPLVPTRVFLRRLAWSGLAFLAFIALSLGIGTAGYHWMAGLPWVDALLNASMILAGMGPVDPLTSSGAKLFATFYALFSGVAFLTSIGVLLAPVLHRLLHRFHIEASAGADDDAR
jgi:hypothetical protein